MTIEAVLAPAGQPAHIGWVILCVVLVIGFVVVWVKTMVRIDAARRGSSTDKPIGSLVRELPASTQMSAPRRISQSDAYRAFLEAGGVAFLWSHLAVKDGEVLKAGDWRELVVLGPLAGARAETVEFRGSGRQGRGLTLVVRFADGTIHSQVLDPGTDVSAEVAEFNALARAAMLAPPPPVPALAAWECVYCRTTNQADQGRCDQCGAPVRQSRLQPGIPAYSGMQLFSAAHDTMTQQR